MLVVFLLVFLVCMCMGNALHVLFDFLRSAFHLFRYLPEDIRIWEAAVFRMGSRGRGIPTRTPCLL